MRFCTFSNKKSRAYKKWKEFLKMMPRVDELTRVVRRKARMGAIRRWREDRGPGGLPAFIPSQGRHKPPIHKLTNPHTQHYQRNTTIFITLV